MDCEVLETRLTRDELLLMAVGGDMVSGTDVTTLWTGSALEAGALAKSVNERLLSCCSDEVPDEVMLKR